MMFRALLFLLLLPAAARAQLTLYSVTAEVETPVGGTYNVGPVAAGASLDTRFRARNLGSAAILITKLALSGSNFALVTPLSPPPAIGPGNFLDIDIAFLGGPPAQYSANFQVNGISVLMLATSVPAASLSVLSGCTGPDPSTGAINFGTVQVGQTGTCALALHNGNAQALTVAVSVTGLGFQAAAQTLALSPGGTVNFNITFTPGVGALFSGVLTVDARAYPLSGSGFNPPLPTPMLLFDSAASHSGQQITLTMRLPSPSPIAGAGAVNLQFQPDNPALIGDTAVYFLAGQVRSVPFTVKLGDTQILLGGQAGAVFQTGTTSGKLTFTISGNFPIASDPTTFLMIPPAPIEVDTASATRRAGDLDIQMTGFDNTYSAGAMTFTFYDLAGNQVARGPVPANFVSDFHAYFSSAPGTGSAFQMRVSFPVTGDSGLIGAVDMQLSNTVGTTTVMHLPFQ